jgi:hypothetical protein
MALYVYTTEQCKKDIRDHSYENRVDRFKEKILKEQSTTLFEPYPPTFLKKRFERQIRLIAGEKYIDEHVIVCFYRLFVRGSKDYETFRDDPKGYGDKTLSPLVTDEVLKSWLNEQHKESPAPQKLEATDDERHYLWGSVSNFGRVSEEIYVCESPDWLEHLQNKAVQNRIAQAQSAIFDMASDEAEGVEFSVGNQLTILGRYFATPKKLFLVAALTNETIDHRNTLEQKYRDILYSERESISEADILKHSSRAYRWELLCDLDLWLEAERDEIANLALSPEEAEILQSVSLPQETDSTTGFPLFINGRAGSGKSTILQYLFADYLFFHLSHQNGENRGPIYLTCSSGLLERSRTVLLKLIHCGHQFAEKRDTKNIPDMEVTSDNIHDHFQEFHTFLYTKLTAEESRDTFHRNKYIDYPKFRSLWTEKFSKDKVANKEYPPDIAWHVLRTYIKGLSQDDYLDEDEYDELPKGEKSVTKETFETIYSRVWSNWYRHLIVDQGYWDDQELVRYLLNEERITPEYTAIFADEAQDFTRIELEALFRLSVFSNRKLSPQDLGRVPFAFAGDPFQTLNPTGFRWESIKSAFVEKFVHSLDPAKQSQVKDLNYHELSYNYRSARNIVTFCNSIQLLRSALFGIVGITPQTTWKYEENSPMPFWFERGDETVRESLKKEQDITIIVPCELGEEAEFVRDSTHLLSLVRRDEAGVPQNVLSPAAAKGLEFNRVLLYGFGEYFIQNLARKSISDLIDGKLDINNPTETIPYEYFLNKLYVAASRPKKRLFVVDSEAGIRNLWSFCTEQRIQNILVSRIRQNRERWRENIGSLIRGGQESWSEDREDISVIAERLEQEGHSQKNANMLRSASMYYASINKALKEKACKADALALEKEFTKAGLLYEEIEDYENALNVYWTGHKYEEIQLLASQKPSLLERLEVRLSNFLCQSPSLSVGVTLLKDLVSQLGNSDVKNALISTDSWNQAIPRFLKHFLGYVFLRDNIADETWREIDLALNSLADFRVDKSLQARIAHHLGDYERAVALWQLAGDTKHELFQKANQFILVKKCEGLEYTPTREEATVIAKYYVDEKEFEKALNIMGQFGLVNDLKHLLIMQVNANASEMELVNTINSVFTSIVKIEDWEDLRHYMGQKPLIAKKHDVQLKRLIQKHALAMNASIIAELAQSQGLVSASNRDVKQRVSDFLKRLLIMEGYEWLQYIEPELAGAALERSGRDVDCLQFYENIQGEKRFTKEQQERAAIRWVKCKFRQAAREQQNNMPVAEKHSQEALNRKKELGIADDNPFFNAEFPPVGRFVHNYKERERRRRESSTEGFGMLPEKVTKWKDKFKLKLEEFEVEYARGDGKLNIKKGMDVASVRLAKKQCSSVDVTFLEKDGVFECAEWNLTIDLSRIETSNKIALMLKSLGVSLDLMLR